MNKLKTILVMVGIVFCWQKSVQATRLHDAVNACNKDLVIELLNAGFSIDALNSTGATPLYMAVMKNYQDIATLLLERGATANTADSTIGWTPLHWAAVRGNRAMIDLLISHKAQVSAKDKKGLMASDRALSAKRYEVCLYLLPLEEAQ